MPVFVKAGGIVPEQPGTLNVAAAAGKPLTVRVFSGASGQFSLYSDAGTGLGYQHGQATLTQITNEPGTASPPVTLSAPTALHPANPLSPAFHLHLAHLSLPTPVTLL